jgi:GTP-binding protein HflX
VEIDVLLPYTAGSLAARVHSDGEVLSERHTAEGTRMRARVGLELANAVEQFSVANGARPLPVSPRAAT